MTKALMLAALFSASVSAAEPAWEYRVIYLPGAASSPDRVERLPSGAYLDAVSTAILNKLAIEGWEIVAIAGASSADHAVYLKRRR